MTFSSLTLPEFGGFLTVLAGMLVGFYGIAKVMLVQATKDRDADREERKLFAGAINNMAESSEKVASTNKDIARAVTKQATESAQRNGHLGELIVNQGEMAKQLTDSAVNKIIDSVQHVSKQEVEHQHVVTKEEE